MSEQRVGLRLILIADRNEIIRKVLRGILVRQGFRVLTAATASAARQIIWRLGPRLDAVVAESELTGGAGIDIAGEVARMAPLVPLLVMSNPDPYPQPEPERAWTITKPFTQEHLLSRLRDLMAVRPKPVDKAAAVLRKAASAAS